MTRYSPYAASVHPDGGTDTPIVVTSQNVNTGVEVNTGVTAGNPNASYGEVTSVNPGGTITTPSINTLLSAIGMQGICLDDAAATTGFVLWALKREACSALSSGSVHTKMIIPNGYIVPRTLSVAHGSRATATAEVFALYDGTNDPLIFTGSQAAPTNLPQDTIGFHMGPVSVAGETIAEKASLEINFGVNVRRELDDGDVYPTDLFIDSVKPTVSVTLHDIAPAVALGIGGLHGTHANTSFVLRKKTHGTAGFSSGTDHIEFTIDGIATVQSIGSNGHNPHSVQIMYDALDDDTNAIIVADFEHELS